MQMILDRAQSNISPKARPSFGIAPLGWIASCGHTLFNRMRWAVDLHSTLDPGEEPRSRFHSLENSISRTRFALPGSPSPRTYRFLKSLKHSQLLLRFRAEWPGSRPVNGLRSWSTTPTRPTQCRRSYCSCADYIQGVG